MKFILFMESDSVCVPSSNPLFTLFEFTTGQYLLECMFKLNMQLSCAFDQVITVYLSMILWGKKSTGPSGLVLSKIH